MKKILSLAIVYSLLNLNAVADEPSIKTSSSVYQDWELACVEQGENKRCEVKQTLSNNAGQVVAVLTVAKPDKETLFQVALPHMLDLKRGVKLEVDGNALKTLEYSFCNQAACFILEREPKELISSFNKGTESQLVATQLDGKKLTLVVSLNGFAAALKALM